MKKLWKDSSGQLPVHQAELDWKKDIRLSTIANPVQEAKYAPATDSQRQHQIASLDFTATRMRKTLSNVQKIRFVLKDRLSRSFALMAHIAHWITWELKSGRVSLVRRENFVSREKIRQTVRQALFVCGMHQEVILVILRDMRVR